MQTPPENEPAIEDLVRPDDDLGGQRPPTSPRKIAWMRRSRTFNRNWSIFKTSGIGMFGLAILVIFIAIALTAPFFVSPEDLSKPAAAREGTPITMRPSMLINDAYIEQYVSQLGGSPEFQAETAAKLEELKGTWDYPLGTDGYGRNMLLMMIEGSQISLIVGFAATVMTMIIGAGIGISAGYFGGRTDGVLERLTDWFLVIPFIPLTIVLASLLSPSLWNIILVIAVTSWPVTARLVRSQALTVSQRPYVERGRALGAGNWHIMSRHMLPNLFPIIFANTVLTVAITILTESYLSFLGLGPAEAVSWGSLLEEAREVGGMSGGYWWYVFPPGIAISLVVLSFTFVGVAIEEVTNPKLRKR